jgi:hypothetical protein
VGDPDNIPRLPEYNHKKDEKKFMEVLEAKVEQEAKPKPTDSRNKYPTIISNSKTTR